MSSVAILDLWNGVSIFGAGLNEQSQISIWERIIKSFQGSVFTPLTTKNIEEFSLSPCPPPERRPV